MASEPKAPTEDVKLDLFEDDDEFEEFEIDEEISMDGRRGNQAGARGREADQHGDVGQATEADRRPCDLRDLFERMEALETMAAGFCTMQQLQQPRHPLLPPPPQRHEMMRQFQDQRPNKFSGGVDPLMAEEWLDSLESIFTYLATPDRYKVDCATYLLTYDARAWWKTTSLTVDAAQLTWTQFKEMFEEKYVPDSLRSEWISEFLSLTQGSFSVPEYVRKFEQLGRFVPFIFGDETQKMKHFLRGLNPALRGLIRIMHNPTFLSMVDRAIALEKDRRDMIRAAQQRRSIASPSSAARSTFRYTPYSVGSRSVQRGGARQGHRSGAPTGSTGGIFQPPGVMPRPIPGPNRSSGSRGRVPPIAANTGSNIPANIRVRRPCTTCRKNHPGVCMRGTPFCFRCKERGHLASSCPHPPPREQGVSTRVFAITQEEADHELTDVICAGNEEDYGDFFNDELVDAGVDEMATLPVDDTCNSGRPRKKGKRLPSSGKMTGMMTMSTMTSRYS